MALDMERKIRESEEAVKEMLAGKTVSYSSYGCINC